MVDGCGRGLHPGPAEAGNCSGSRGAQNTKGGECMKKTYERPKLVEHGDIRKMTRDDGSGDDQTGDNSGDFH